MSLRTRLLLVLALALTIAAIITAIEMVQRAPADRGSLPKAPEQPLEEKDLKVNKPSQPQSAEKLPPRLKELLYDDKVTVLSPEEKQLYREADPALRTAIAALAYARIDLQQVLQDPRTDEKTRAESAEFLQQCEERVRKAQK